MSFSNLYTTNGFLGAGLIQIGGNSVINENTLVGMADVSSRPSVNDYYLGGADDQYAVNIDENSDQGEILAFVNESSLIKANSPLTIESSGNTRSGIIKYVVQPGDVPSIIAAKHGITTNTLLWANNLSDGQYIRPGDTLDILPVSGLAHSVKSGDTVEKIARKYNASTEEIIAFNSLPANGAIRVGDKLIVPGGEKPRVRVKRPYYAPVPRYASLSAKTASGYYIMPTTGRNWGRLHPHNAVDIANSCGTPIYAAAGGTVTIADSVGWNGGYGIYMQVSHPNGTATRYAHMSKIIKPLGSTVAKGQLIGLMGTTGRSTGCHVHFEIWGARNPFTR